MSRRLPIIPALLATALALAVAAVAFSAWEPGGPSAAHPRLELTSDQLHLTQTRGGHALIRIPNAEAGQRAQGATTITVGGATAEVSVRATNLRGAAGPNGGRLIESGRLWIDVRCARPPCGTPPYRGPMSEMGTHSLGTWPAGTRRAYRVRVWLVRGGEPASNRSGDNAFQGSRAAFGLLWTATAP